MVENPFVKQEMLNFLQNKYGIEFECASFRNIDSFRQEMDAYVKGDSNQHWFTVHRVSEPFSPVEMCDSYSIAEARPYYEEKIQEIAQKYFGECSNGVTFRSHYPPYDPIPNDIVPSKNMEAFKTWANKRLCMEAGIYIIANDESEIPQETLDSFYKELEELNDIGDITIFGFPKEAYDEYASVKFRPDGVSVIPLYSKFEIDKKWGNFDMDYVWEGAQ